MSWAEIKKSVNSDLNVPLNSILNNNIYGLSALQTLINDLKTAGVIPSVKSVQRGLATIPKNQTSVTVNISTINMNKSIALITGTGNLSAGNTILLGTPYITISSQTKITISTPLGTSIYNSSGSFAWQVIEFY